MPILLKLDVYVVHVAVMFSYVRTYRQVFGLGRQNQASLASSHGKLAPEDLESNKKLIKLEHLMYH